MVSHLFIVADTEQNILDLSVLSFDIVDVTGSDKGNAGFAGYLDKALVDRDLILIIQMRTKLEKKIILPKNIVVFKGYFFGALVVTIEEFRWHLALE
jgi:hypothetical protein